MLMTNGRKKAVITGATSGIGAAYVHSLAARGYDLIITGRRRNIIENVARETEKRFGVRVIVAITELSNERDVDLLTEQIKKACPIDVLVNNAGFTTKGFYHQEDIIEQENMVLVHVSAMMKLTHAVIPGMIERKVGTIINVASLQAVTPMSLSTTYSSAKAFMKNFSMCLHCELRAHGIKIQCVLPGFTRTDLGRGLGVDMNIIEDKPARKWMRPEEVVSASLRELEKKNSVLCIPGVGNKIAYVAAKIIPERLWYMIEPGIVNNMP
ncbi:MAG: SDR family NAD(P)-dependent oxidoreductase [Smithella sp.]|jgi:short-subunit dehydrogenase